MFLGKRKEPEPEIIKSPSISSNNNDIVNMPLSERLKMNDSIKQLLTNNSTKKEDVTMSDELQKMKDMTTKLVTVVKDDDEDELGLARPTKRKRVMLDDDEE